MVPLMEAWRIGMVQNSSNSQEGVPFGVVDLGLGLPSLERWGAVGKVRIVGVRLCADGECFLAHNEQGRPATV